MGTTTRNFTVTVTLGRAALPSFPQWSRSTTSVIACNSVRTLFSFFATLHHETSSAPRLSSAYHAQPRPSTVTRPTRPTFGRAALPNIPQWSRSTAVRRDGLMKHAVGEYLLARSHVQEATWHVGPKTRRPNEMARREVYCVLSCTATSGQLRDGQIRTWCSRLPERLAV